MVFIYFPGPYSLQLTDNHQKIYISVSGEATVSEKNRRFYLISPGVSGRDNTVSLESADWPGKYLVWRTDDPIHEGSGENDTATKREDGIETMSDDRYSITVESKNNTLDPGTFLQRSTWHLFKSEFIHQAVSLAPAQDGWQLPVHFIRHENSQVVLDYYQPHEEFEASCSFRLVEGSINQQKQTISITFVQHQPNVSDVGPTLYKCYTNFLCLLMIWGYMYCTIKSTYFIQF